MARALSPSDGKRSRALDPGPAVSVRPRPRSPGPGGGECSVPAHAARALHGPEKPLQGGGSRVPSASRGNNGNLGMRWNHPAANPEEVALAPAVTGTDTLPRCRGCSARCCARDAAGSLGLKGSPEPHPGSVPQHRHSVSSQLPCAGRAGAGDGEESHGSIPALGKRAVQSSRVLLLPPESGEQKGNSPH